MFRQFGAQELLIILLIVVLLFGAKKLPETARGLGRSLRIFKAETKGLSDDDAPTTASQAGAATPTTERPHEISAQRTQDPPLGSPDPSTKPSTSADERP